VDQLNSTISSNLAIVAGVLVFVGLLVALLVVALLVQTRRLARLTARVDGLTRGVDGHSLESVFEAHLETVFRVARDLDALSARATALETAARRHFDRVGLVRFNPFEDTGGNQSFALALLDGNLDGFVVSSLHSRTGTRIYAKSINGGAAETALSAEETRALDLARAQTATPLAPPASRMTGRRSGGDTARADSTDLRGSSSGVTASAGQVSSTTPVESLEPTDMQVDADFLERRLGGQDGGSRVRPSWKDTPRS
jgi:hypothetical protein